MRSTNSTISIRAIPGKLDGASQVAFIFELEDSMNVDRPKIVLDCSRLSQLDPNSIHLLLSCLEVAMRRNGDVRLASLQPTVLAALKAMGLDQIFRTFDDLECAVESFGTFFGGMGSSGMSDLSDDQRQSSAA